MSTLEKLNNLNENECIVDQLLIGLLEHPCAKCGKCVFGYEGISQLQMILKDIISNKAQAEDYELLLELSTNMSSHSLCEDGKKLGDTLLQILKFNREEFMEHITQKGCRAGVCKKFLTFHVLASKCKGCDECQDICEEDAILGKKGLIHVIDMDNCMQCGRCVDICEQHAIVTAGIKKPKGPKKPIPVKK